MPIYAIDNLVPVVKPNTFIHPTASIIGDVIIEENCYIGPGASLRGDFGRIIVSANSNIQDNCVLHSFPDKDCTLEPYSHIGHAAVLHGCTIGKNSLIGINAVIMDDAIIGAESIVAASAFVKARFSCEPRSLVIGTPAKFLRFLTDQEFAWKQQGTREYIELAERCFTSLKIVEPLDNIQTNRPRYRASNFKPKT